MTPQQNKETLAAVTDRMRLCVDIRQDIVDAFADCFGDKNAMHTDILFARRSPYRQRVVHGMCLVAYLGFLDSFRDSRRFIQTFRVHFRNPAFVGDRVVIETQDPVMDASAEQYHIINQGTGVVLSTIHVQWGWRSETSLSQDQAQGMQTSIKDIFEESVQEWHDIRCGDTHSMPWQSVRSSLERCYAHLAKGLHHADRFRMADNALIELSVILAHSTYVGMCCPGRYAAFMSLSIQFDQPLWWNMSYLLRGQVTHKSEKGRIVVQKIEWVSAADMSKPLAYGDVRAMVHSVPKSMPGMQALRHDVTELGLKDKVALVTGGSRGIGEVIAKALAGHHVKVMVNYIRGQADAEGVVRDICKNGGTAHACQADVTCEEDVHQMMNDIQKKYGAIDILVNSAVADTRPIAYEHLRWNDLQQDLDVICKGAFLCSQAVLPQMKKQSYGRIINMSSIFAENPVMKQTKYIVAKNALVGLTRCLALEHARFNITANLVVPSMTQTDLSSHVPHYLFEEEAQNTPCGRNVSPVDIAKAVIFLASQLSSFTTGQKIMVTGGQAPYL